MNFKHNFQTLFQRIFKSRDIKFRRPCSTYLLDVNTNVVSDTILYKYEDPKYFRRVFWFGAVQCVVWTSFSYTIFQGGNFAEMKLLTESKSIWRKLNTGSTGFKDAITALSAVAGIVSLAAVWLFTSRSIRCITLKKGGKKVNIVTYGRFGATKSFTTTVSNCNCRLLREETKYYIPLKVRFRFMFYLLDKKGEFLNPVLYDNTVGCRRYWK